MEFDWFTLGFALILALSALIGFLKGGLKTLFKFGIVALSIILALLLCDALSPIFKNGQVGEYFYSFIFDRIGDAYPEANKDQLSALIKSEAGQSIILEAYTKAGIPESLREIFTKEIMSVADSNITVNVGDVIASTASSYICLGLAFICILLGSLIVLFAIYFIIMLIFKLTKKKPGLISRIIGILMGLIEAIAICWCISLFANFALASNNNISEIISKMIKIDDPNYWSLGKWMIQTDLGYSWILGLVLK